jgi:hypothetical protein
MHYGTGYQCIVLIVRNNWHVSISNMPPDKLVGHTIGKSVLLLKQGMEVQLDTFLNIATG